MKSKLPCFLLSVAVVSFLFFSACTPPGTKLGGLFSNQVGKTFIVEIKFSHELHPVFEKDTVFFLPFELRVHADSISPGYRLQILHSEEILDLRYLGSDSLERWEFPFFQSELWFAKIDTGPTEAYWYRVDKQISYPLRMIYDRESRFPRVIDPVDTLFPLSSRYQLSIVNPEEQDSEQHAVAIWSEQEEGVVHGTFLTESGDYRYLVGNRSGNRIQVSTFNGVFAYIIDIHLQDGHFTGWIHYGASTSRFLFGKEDADARLSSPSQISHFKQGVDTIRFSLPRYQNGEVYTWTPGKVSLIQIMGSWCPNCLDETRLFHQFYHQFSDKGLQLIAISFERHAELELAFPAIDKFVQDLEIEYPVLFGGKASTERVGEVFPDLMNFQAYPTTIFIDKKGKVRKIYTGFNGPATPEYGSYVQETTDFIEELLNE